MTISKHLHSCLLIEDQGKTILIDPGIFTHNEKALPVDSISHLDYILITHEHPDHMYIPFIQELVKKFPNVTIVTNLSAAALLAKEGITAATQGDTIVTIANASHEKLWDTQVPQNVIVTVCDKLIHPGDSLQFSETKDILCLPIQAPWGSTTEAVEKALSLKPKVIIPIHDWMWKDGFRLTMYKRLKDFFATHAIRFEGLEEGPLSL